MNILKSSAAPVFIAKFLEEVAALVEEALQKKQCAICRNNECADNIGSVAHHFKIHV